MKKTNHGTVCMPALLRKNSFFSHLFRFLSLTTVFSHGRRSLLTGLASISFLSLLMPFCTAFAFLSSSENAILANAPGLSPHVLDHALHAYDWARVHTRINNPNILTIVDFSKPSTEKRLWVIDLRTDKTLMNLYTTHGSHSGGLYATQFSNRPGSEESSLGVYKTAGLYSGKHGLSERLQGLEPGVNSNAMSRAIVIHSAPYASPYFIASHHQAGRSWGCFAVSPSESNKLIHLTENGSVLYAYAKPEDHDVVAV